MKNLPHKIINHLFEHYTDAEQPILLNKLADSFIDDKNELRKAKSFKLMLDAFEKNGYIIWSSSTYSEGTKAFLLDDSYKIELGTTNRQGKEITLNYVNVRASLTPSGLDYAIDINRKSVQHRNNNLAIIFSFLTFLLSVGSLYRIIITQRELKSQQQSLEMRLQATDNNIQSQRNDLNHFIQERRNDSIKKVSGNSKHE